MQNNLQAVIFDFDYTLADSSQGAIECINFAFDQMGLDRVTDEAACRTIGLSFLLCGPLRISARSAVK